MQEHECSSPMNEPVYIAGDPGAISTVSLIASELGGSLRSMSASNAHTANYWLQQFLVEKPSVIFTGTSDSRFGFGVEAAARVAAGRMNIPTVVIEDFPGNYRHISGVRDHLLVTDGLFSMELARSRSPAFFESAIALPGLRYDHLRTGKPIFPARENRTVLWAGQPDTEDAIATLENLAPTISALELRLLFRAHPRDHGYTRGRYSDVLGKLGPKVVDVTKTAWQDCLRMSPALVVTQFSAVAVELGFYGIPAIYVLYKDIGQRRLLDKKGYPTPPLCIVGAAWALQDPGHENATLTNALDAQARSNVIEAFSAHMRVNTRQIPILRDYLYNHGLINFFHKESARS